MFYIIGLVVCVILFIVGLPGFGFWGLILLALIWGYSDHDFAAEERQHKNSGEEREERFSFYDKVYEDGSNRIENLSKTGYYYSDGTKSWVDMLGNEHRSNGEVLMDNAYVPGQRDVYNEEGECIAYEIEDCMGVTHRFKK